MKIFTTIRGKLIFYLSMIITVVFGILAIYIYKSESKKRIADVENSVVQIMTARNQQFAAIINGYIEQAKLFSQKPEIYNLNKSTLPSVLDKLDYEETIRLVDVLHKDGSVSSRLGHKNVDARKRGYYKDIFENKKDRSMFAVKTMDTQENIMGIAVPLLNSNNEPIAAMLLSFTLEKLSDLIISQMNLLDGETFIVDENQKVLMHSEQDKILKVDFNDQVKEVMGMQELVEKLKKEDIGKQNIMLRDGTENIVFFMAIENTPGWSIGFEIPRKNIEAPVKAMLMKLLIGFVLAIILCLAMIFVLSNVFIAGPINKAKDFIERISEGQLDITIDSNQNDEIGQMINTMLKMVSRLKEIVMTIISTSDNLLSSSQELSSASQQIAQGANEQAGSIEEVSATMEQITSNIIQSTDNANQTAHVSEEANKGIVKISERSKEAVDANKLIAEKIMMINAIADKTDLLAINASIEAARAGEHGKGFAVVAAEVRKLAENSQKAADEIIHLAETSLNTTVMAGEVMSETVPKIENAFQLVQEIAAAGNEQQSGTRQVNDAIQQLNNVTQQNASASEELASNAVEMSNQANMLKEVMSFFKVETDSSSYKKKTKTDPNKIKNNPGNFVGVKELVNLPNENKKDIDFESF